MKRKYILISLVFLILGFVLFLNQKENNHHDSSQQNTIDDYQSAEIKSESPQGSEREELEDINKKQREINISETKTIGSEGGELEITLSNETMVELAIPSEIFEQGTEITLSESDINPYRKNNLFETVALFEISSSKEIGTLTKGAFLPAKVIPKNGIDLDRIEELQVLVFVTEENGQQYWKDAKVFAKKSQQNDGIEIYFKELGNYKIEYSKIMSPTKTKVLR